MAPKKNKTANVPTPAGVKMVQRHTEFQEADVSAQAADSTAFSGPNPYREGTAAWMGWENIQRQNRGQPATNTL